MGNVFCAAPVIIGWGTCFARPRFIKVRGVCFAKPRFIKEDKMSKVISTPKAPAAVGPYSQAIQVSEVTDIIFTSGQLGLIPETGEFAEGGVEAQARQALENIKAVLSEAGLTMKNVVKTTVLLADIADFAAVNAIYAEYFEEGSYPARSAFQVAALPKGGLVEIETVAAR